MKTLLLFMSFTLCSFQLHAQSLNVKKYTVSITDLKVTDRPINVTDDMIRDAYYEGFYTITKDSKELIKQQFSASKFSNSKYGTSTLNVNIKNEAGQGNTTSYSYDTKRIDYYGEKIKAKKTGTIQEIIISSIVVYAQLTYD